MKKAIKNGDSAATQTPAEERAVTRDDKEPENSISSLAPAEAPAQSEAAGASQSQAPSVKPVEQVPSEVEVLRDRLLRLRADFDNFRKRMDRERSGMRAAANEAVLGEVIPVLDHLELAIAAAGEHVVNEGVVGGFKLVADQLAAVLRKFGVEPIDGTGQKFDPTKHEAVSCVPSDEHGEGTVISQARRGYALGGKVLRAAQVVVSSGTRQVGEDEPGEE